ncbi:hypothetical protein PL11201_130033 [Planktothrix sp. PCC 11201]|uniref:hypothetical protein n=1 Tax=Planktothrix sp. PCC 11201 TaxID=1729650 RepID=UPI000919FDC3|nr:hypothetical protein [Planktothrix sp. PCC 11201]SKB11267.1 hypothetical protein PL11201_130033 [Planktothrix sp. PCC 11201]
MNNLPDQPPVEQLRDFINRVTQEATELKTDFVPEVGKDIGKLIDFLNEIKEKLPSSN